MDIQNLKHVVGEYKEGAPAYMRFYGAVDEYNTARFNEEFLWLQEVVKPSKIVVSINSEGGSVLYGMETYALMQNSSIEVETIIEGLAASMGSILWAAGTRSYMRDYSILMIHNPFVKNTKDNADPDVQQTIKAFQKQIETIYRRRFGLSKDKVREIMDGAEGCDGTYLDAEATVAAGIIPADHVLKTPKQLSTKAKNQIEGLSVAADIREIMTSINAELDDFKPLPDSVSIPKQNQIENSNSTKMEKEQEFIFGSVCAQLGLQGESDAAAVTNRIKALVEAEANVKTLQAALDALEIEKAGVDAQLTNVTDELNTAKTELQAYKDAEEAQRNEAIEKMVDDAIEAGKISADSKNQWVEMAKGNFDMVQATLDSISPREKITEKIANDPANINDAEESLTDLEKKIQQEVEAVVGKDFQFKTLD